MTTAIQKLTDAGLLTRQMPEAVDLEQSLLGAIIIESNCAAMVMDKLERDDFYNTKNRMIFEALAKMWQTGEVIDMLTLCNVMREQGTLNEAGGAYYITQLCNMVNQTGHIESWAKKLNTYKVRRNMIAGTIELQRRAYDITEDPFELAGLASQLATTCTIKQHAESTLLDLGKEFVEDLEAGVSDPGMTQGLQGPDQAYRWMRGEFHILAARPAMGKTAYAVNGALNTAEQEGNSVVIFTLEVTKKAMYRRMIANRARVSVSKLKHNNLTKEERARAVRAAEQIADLPVKIIEAHNMTVEEIRAMCHTIKHKHGLDIVIVDHLLLIALSNFANDKTRGTGHVSRMLKVISVELNVSVVGLCQLNRAVETRGGDKRPQLSDLRETGDLEQDADTVSFLYRPPYYELLQDDGTPFPENFAMLLHAKSRDGETGHTALSFSGAYSLFEDWIE